VQAVWEAVPALNVDPAACYEIQDIWADNQMDKVRNSVLLAFLWEIWKRRNTMVFRGDAELVHILVNKVALDIVLWAHRCPKEHDPMVLNDWG
jgi:hypothetical protein